jgi:hypothetical protein
MFNKLKKDWQISSKDLDLILCTFALSGTLTA